MSDSKSDLKSDSQSDARSEIQSETQSETQSDFILEVQDLTVDFRGESGKTRAVKSISFTL